ncbi:MAG: patatin-like phospholipase family protein, partial [Xanthomonadales bacterium]|nr:patatin-like phospholipase family protein [Xanthomonadales bacterium]
MPFRTYLPRLVALLCLLLPTLVLAQRPTVGLVLGGGGARGAAHIGVLQVLEEHHIAVDLVTGTSMGALVGGLYAAGHSPQELEQLVVGIDWRRMFDDAPPRGQRSMRRKREDLDNLAELELGMSADYKLQVPRGALQGHNLLLWLRRNTLPVAHIQQFDDLPIPFACVATEIVGGGKAVLNGGDLPLAMRASMAVPGVFAPIRVNEKLMVDGGLVDNLPVSVAREMGATHLIVVDVAAPLYSEAQLDSPLAVTMQMITTLMKAETDRTLAELASADVFLQPALGEFSSAAFDQSADAIALGRAAAEKALPRLLTYQLDDEAWAVHLAARRERVGEWPQVARIQVDDHRSASAGRVGKAVQSLQSGEVDPDALDAALQLAMSEGEFERINYRIADGQEPTLVIQPVDKGWGPGLVRFGFALGDDFEGNSNYQAEVDLRMTGLDRRGREWRNRLSLGRRAGLLTELHQPFGGAGQYYGLGFASYEAFEQPIQLAGVRLAELGIKRLLAGVELGWYPTPAWQLSAGLERGRRRFERTVGSPEDVEALTNLDLGAVHLAVTYDTLDNVGFPTRGARLDSALLVYLDALGTSQEADVFRLRYDQPLA